MAVLAAPLVAGSPLVPSVVAVTAGAAASAVWWQSAVPARAATPPQVLILGSSVNGGTSSAEYQAAVAAGYSPTVISDSTWESEPKSYFTGFSAIIIGDPSSGGTCAATVPTALAYVSSGQATAVWTQAVTGNVTVLGTAPALAGRYGTPLMTDGIRYAASGTGTGLYVSLNCEGSSASSGADLGAGWLDDVNGTGVVGAGVLGGATIIAGQGWSCGDSGTINPQAAANPGYGALTASSLTGWASSACPVQETFGAWPSWLTPVAYDTSATPADFTSPDGTSAGQPYVLAGQVPGSGLAPSVGGQIPMGSQAGGSNPAAPQVQAAMVADPVSTENGDMSESSTDLSIPTFGPDLEFTRTYDAGQARLQAMVGNAVPTAPAGPSGNGNGAAPGSMGYGWTSDWDSWAATGQPMPGNLYTISGLGTDNGNGGDPTKIPLYHPGPVIWHNDVYFADTGNNRILEVPGSSGSQWGMQMTAGDVYQIAGSPLGQPGRSNDGTAMTKSLLNSPTGIAVDSSGDLYIADSGNNRVIEIPVSSGTQWGNPNMKADKIYNVAGHGTGAPGHGGDGSAAINAFLSDPVGLAFDPSGDLYIADNGNNRIQEVFTSGGQQWTQSMSANDIYTVAGSSNGSGGDSPNGTPAINALLSAPSSVSFSSAGDMYIADTANNRVIEVPQSSGSQWGITSMSADDIYTVAGSAAGVAGSSGDGGPSLSAKLNQPMQVELDNGKQLYIADEGNSRIQEVAQTSHTEWNVPMTQNDIYTIAGTGTNGFSGDNGPALSANLSNPEGFALFGTADLYIADTGNNRMRVVSGTTYNISEFAGNGATLLSVGNNGPALGSAYFSPAGVASDAMGNLYIADEYNNRVQEIAASSHTQFGITMTAGDVYTIAGNANGNPGYSGDGGKATSALLNNPAAVAIDSAGHVFIADYQNNRIQEIDPGGTISTIAGSATGAAGYSGDGGPATSALLSFPVSVAVDGSGNIYIADQGNNRVQEVTSAGTMKTIAGSATGSYGTSGDGGPATSALLDSPSGVAVDSSGDLYVADTYNHRIQEIYAGGNSWSQNMTAGNIYTIAGSASGSSGISGDGGPATAGLLYYPVGLAIDTSGDLYIADTDNNRVQEIAATGGTQWGQSMTADAIYTIAGSPAGAMGDTGVGRSATSTLLNGPSDLAVDPVGNLVIPDDTNNVLDEVIASPGSALYPVSPAGTGITINQPGQSQITFYPKANGACPTGYVQAGTGGYCAPPQDKTATLTYDNSHSTYTYSPSPSGSYTYNSAGTFPGSLASETDAAGENLTVSYRTPAPGSGNCPSTANWCQTIASASGRALTIGYNSANLITSVTDPMGRQWAYAYNSASQLTSATDPMGKVTSYTYGQGSSGDPSLTNNLLSITNPNAQPGGPDAGHATVNAYDNQGRVISQIDPAGNSTTFSYCVNTQARNCLSSAAGNGAVTVTDPQGNQTKFTYSSGVLTATAAWNGTVDGAGATLATSSYTTPNQADGSQLSTADVDGNGNVTTYQYNSAGYATTTTTPDGIGSQTAALTRTITPLGDVSCYSSFELASACAQNSGPQPVQPGQPITPPATPAAGLVETQFDTNGNQLYTTESVDGTAVTSYTLFQGNSVTLNGTNIACATKPPSPSLPCATISAAGVVTQLTYDAFGDLAASSTPDGNSGGEVSKTTYTYDGDGEPTGVTSPDGNVSGAPPATTANYTTTSAYNADGELTAATAAGGQGATATPRTTNYTYDADGNQITATDPRGYTTKTAYNADGEPTLVTDPLGNSTLTCYDGAGNIAQTVPPVGVAANSLTASSCPTSYPSGYNPAGSARLASDSVMTTYNGAGEQTATYTPAPSGQTGYETSTNKYDANGNLTQTTAPPASPGGQPQVSTYTYNTTGEMTSDTSADGTVTYCYDANGDRTSVIAADGNVNGAAPCNTNPSYPWIVDPTTYPQAAYQTTSTYDSSGALKSTTTPATAATGPNGGKTTYTYNTAGQMLTQTDPNGVTSTVAYTPLGKIASVSFSGKAAPTISYSYDAQGQVTSMSDGTGTSSYIYDPFGELTSATNGSSQTVGYSYDADGNTAGVTYPLPAAATWATTSTVNYSYDKADNLTSVTDFNGHNMALTLNPDGNPTAETLGSTGDTFSATYDPTGSPSAISLKNASSTLQSFSYSDAPNDNVMTETDTPSSTHSPASYTYDSQGRLTSMTPGTGQKLNYTFDASGNLTSLPNAADASNGYDHAGELTKSVLNGTTTTYTYDANGHQLSATQGSTAISSGTWDGANQLTSYTDPAAAVTSAAYDGNGLRTSATFTPSGGPQQQQNFVWGIAGLLMDSTNAYIYTGGPGPDEQINLSTGSVSYLVTDALGSVRGIVSNHGTLAATTSYDAWGNPQTAGGLTAYTPFGFAGGYTDPTGLLYLYSRYYNPATGQFLSADPALADTGQPYQYAAADPVDNADPSGAAPHPQHWRVLYDRDVWNVGTRTDGGISVCGGFDWILQFQFCGPYGAHTKYFFDMFLAIVSAINWGHNRIAIRWGATGYRLHYDPAHPGWRTTVCKPFFKIQYFKTGHSDYSGYDSPKLYALGNKGQKEDSCGWRRGNLGGPIAETLPGSKYPGFWTCNSTLAAPCGCNSTYPAPWCAYLRVLNDTSVYAKMYILNISKNQFRLFRETTILLDRNSHGLTQ
jgi:RHS repeat-associated protein